MELRLRCCAWSPIGRLESPVGPKRTGCGRLPAATPRWDDALDSERRQDLYRCAAQVVGTRSSRTTELARLARCERELADLRGGPPPRPLRWIVHCTRVLDRSSHVTAFFDDLARALLRAGDRGHQRALALVEGLVGLEVLPAPPCRVTSGRVDRAVRARRATLGGGRHEAGARNRSAR